MGLCAWNWFYRYDEKDDRALEPIDFEKEHVIAWMPLPKAYKEVEE